MVSPESREYLRRLRETPGFGHDGFDLQGLRAGMATRRPRAGIDMLPQLRGTQIHLTHEPGTGDETGLRKLGIAMTTDARPTAMGYFLR
ncbi:MAG: hypothetical protein AB7Y46_09080 [Armatimonadota bacterium]